MALDSAIRSWNEIGPVQLCLVFLHSADFNTSGTDTALNCLFHHFPVSKNLFFSDPIKNILSNIDVCVF